MITIEINGIITGDGITPLIPASQQLALNGRKVYIQDPVGLIEPNVYFINPGQTLATSQDSGWRLDVVHVEQAGDGVFGDGVFVVDRSMNVLYQALDLEFSPSPAALTRSFPVPPGYAIQLVSSAVRGLRLGMTQLPTVGDLQYVDVNIIA